MEVFDNDKQQQQDVEKIFRYAGVRRHAWITGTEAGDGSNLGEILLDVGRDSGYRLWVPSVQAEGKGQGTDGWLAVRRDLVKGNWNPGYTPVIPSANQLYRANNIDPDTKGLRHWAPQGVVAVEFDSIPQLGKVGVGVSHHLTGGRFPNDTVVGDNINHYELNEKLDLAISEWMAEAGKGRALAFFNCDRNALDRRGNQEIEGATTLADELKKWQPTGHGDIDWMLSYNNDGRVRGVDFNVLDDREFFLNTDHFFCEGTYDVEPLRR